MRLTFACWSTHGQSGLSTRLQDCLGIQRLILPSYARFALTLFLQSSTNLRLGLNLCPSLTHLPHSNLTNQPFHDCCHTIVTQSSAQNASLQLLAPLSELNFLSTTIQSRGQSEEYTGTKHRNYSSTGTENFPLRSHFLTSQVVVIQKQC